MFLSSQTDSEIWRKKGGKIENKANNNTRVSKTKLYKQVFFENLTNLESCHFPAKAVCKRAKWPNKLP